MTFDPTQFFEENLHILAFASIKRWIESYSPLENITDIHLHRDVVELVRDKEGYPFHDNNVHYKALETCRVTITLKGGCKHRVGCVTTTGELYKIGL